MKIAKIERLGKRSWLIETKDKAIAFCNITEKEFYRQLIILINLK